MSVGLLNPVAKGTISTDCEFANCTATSARSVKILFISFLFLIGRVKINK
jgi:hypothetical protein